VAETTASDTSVCHSAQLTLYCHLAENREKLVLYLSVSISAGLLSLLVLVITRLLWQRRRPQIPQSTTLPS
jgi:hypothetical protein